MKKIAVINDLSGFGKCSLAVALPIISAHNLQCCPLPTGIFSNQTDYESYKTVDMTPYMPAFIEEWKKLGAEFDAILTGFIPNSVQGSIILDFINEFRRESTLLAVDPVMGDNGRLYSTYDEKTIAAVKSIAAKADLITPNVTELALLCEKAIDKSFSVEEIEAMVKSLDNQLIAVTGIELEDDEIANAVFDGNRFELIKTKRIGGHFSGTGDIFSAFVTSELVNGESLAFAVSAASRFIERAIESTQCDIGRSYNPDGVDFENLIGIV